MSGLSVNTLDSLVDTYCLCKDELGRAVYHIDKYFFRDTNDANIGMKVVVENIRKRKKFILYGEISSPIQPIRLPVKTIDINGWFVDVNALCTSEVFLQDDLNVYKLLRPTAIGDARFANEILKSSHQDFKELNDVQLWSISAKTKCHISHLSPSNRCILYCSVKSIGCPLRLKLMDHCLEIKSSTDFIVDHRFKVCDDNKKWYNVYSFVGDDLNPIAKMSDYDWPNHEGLTWRMVTDYSVSCNGSVCPITAMPKWKLHGSAKFLIKGKLLPSPISNNSSSSSSSGSSSNYSKIRKPITVEIEVDVLYFQYENHGRGLWVNNVADRTVYYKLESPSQEYRHYATEVQNVFLLYDYLHIVSEKDNTGRLCIEQTVEQIHEVSDAAFDIEFISKNKTFVLLFVKDCINLTQSKPFVKSLSGLQSCASGEIPKKRSVDQIETIESPSIVKDTPKTAEPEVSTFIQGFDNFPSIGGGHHPHGTVLGHSHVLLRHALESQKPTVEDQRSIGVTRKVDDDFPLVTIASSEEKSPEDTAVPSSSSSSAPAIKKKKKMRVTDKNQVDMLFKATMTAKILSMWNKPRSEQQAAYAMVETGVLTEAVQRAVAGANQSLANRRKFSYDCVVCGRIHNVAQCMVNLVFKGLHTKQPDNKLACTYHKAECYCVNCLSSGHTIHDCERPPTICSVCESEGHVRFFCAEIQNLERFNYLEYLKALDEIVGLIMEI